MVSKDLITTIVLGLIGGFTPGPIILVAFSEILQSPKTGLKNGWMYIFLAGLTEFFIGLFLVTTSSWLKIPPVIFHILAILGVLLLMYIAVQLYSIKHIDYDKERKAIKAKHIVMLMILNGPLWLFWLSVCLPIAHSLGNSIRYGEYLFIFIFEISMMLAVTVVLFAFNSIRKYLSNKKTVRIIFITMSAIVFLIALRILFGEFKFLF